MVELALILVILFFVLLAMIAGGSRSNPTSGPPTQQHARQRQSRQHWTESTDTYDAYQDTPADIAAIEQMRGRMAVKRDQWEADQQAKQAQREQKRQAAENQRRQAAEERQSRRGAWQSDLGNRNHNDDPWKL